MDINKQEPEVGYSLESPYYDKVWETENELIQDVMVSGTDPNCYITKDGFATDEKAIDLIQE